jgi:small conductance mechanosensitive channel
MDAALGEFETKTMIGQAAMETDLTSLFDKLLSKLQGWFEKFVLMLPNLVAALLVVFAFGFSSRYVGKVVKSLLTRLTGHEPISDLLGTVARVATLVIGVFVALGLLQLDKTVTSLLAGVGVVGLALGFAFQDIAANFMSGFLMAVRRPFNGGDLVAIGGHFGVIERVDLRATSLHTLDGLSVIIPNKEVFQNPIVNYTRTPSRRMDLTVGVAYGSDLVEVRKVVLEAVRAVPGRLEGRDAEFFYEAFGDSSIEFAVRVWLAEADQISYLRARSEAIIAIKKAFDANDITIPFPIRTLDFGADAVGGVRLDAMRLRVAPESK